MGTKYSRISYENIVIFIDSVLGIQAHGDVFADLIEKEPDIRDLGIGRQTEALDIRLAAHFLLHGFIVSQCAL